MRIYKCKIDYRKKIKKKQFFDILKLLSCLDKAKANSYYLEIAFEQKIINKTKFIVLKVKKKLKYYILRLKKKLRKYILIIKIFLLVTCKENNCRN